MLGWTVVAIGAYLGNTVHLINLIEMAKVPGDLRLPDIDTGLMVLMGLGQGAYLAKKLITSSTPMITKVLPAQVTPAANAILTLNGGGFGVAQAESAINLDGVSTHIQATAWKDTEITFTIPAANLVAGKRQLSVTVESQNSNSVTLTVT